MSFNLNRVHFSVFAALLNDFAKLFGVTSSLEMSAIVLREERFVETESF